MSLGQTDCSRPARLQIGILSTALINERCLLATLPDVDGVAIAAVASRTAERAQAFALAHGIERSYGSYEALLGDPAIDAVYIPLPNALHEEWTHKALAAGKHVLCEKPLGMTPGGVEGMFARAQETRRVLMEAMHYRFHPDVARAVAHIAEGRYGRLLAIDVAFATVARGTGDIRLRPELGGGALADLGCYGLDFMLWLGLDPTPVIRECRALRGPTGVDLRFNATLLCRRSGTTCHLRGDIDAPDFVCQAVVTTNLGTVIFKNIFLPVVSEQGRHRRLFALQTSGIYPSGLEFDHTLPSYVHQLRAFRDRIGARAKDQSVESVTLDRTRLMTDLFHAVGVGRLSGLPT